jgi:hypothetical protein
MKLMRPLFSRLILATVAVAVLVALPVVLLAAGFRIDIQPESGSVTAPMQIYESTACSGGRCIGTDDQERPLWETPKDGGSVKCTFQVDNAGNYYLWVRAKWTEGTCGDSVYLKLDDRDTTKFGEQGTKNAWTWFKVEDPYSLSQGKHTITIYGREDGAKIDKLMFHTSKSYSAQGKDG